MLIIYTLWSLQSSAYPVIFMFSKSKKYHFDNQPLERRREFDLWTITPRPVSAKDIDSAPFPDEVVERCLEIGCPEGGIVLDPFAGSGTTLRVALNHGRNAVGIELNQDFCTYITTELGKL